MGVVGLAADCPFTVADKNKKKEGRRQPEIIANNTFYYTLQNSLHRVKVS